MSSGQLFVLGGRCPLLEPERVFEALADLCSFGPRRRLSGLPVRNLTWWWTDSCRLFTLLIRICLGTAWQSRWPRDVSWVTAAPVGRGARQAVLAAFWSDQSDPESATSSVGCYGSVGRPCLKPFRMKTTSSVWVSTRALPFQGMASSPECLTITRHRSCWEQSDGFTSTVGTRRIQIQNV